MKSTCVGWKAGLATVLVGALAWTASAVIVSGKTFGKWDLPANPSSAVLAEGALLDSSGATVFKMKAKLAETPSPSLSMRQGTMNGVLDNGSGSLFPIYGVSGKWKALALSGDGSFEAVITLQRSPLGPVAVIGKMAGKFSDPPSFPNQVGKYKGEWKADL